MNERRYWKFILLFSCMLLVSIASIAIFIKVQRQYNTVAIEHSSAAWAAGSLQREYQKLYRLLEQYAANDGRVDKAALRLQFEIFWSRVPLLEKGRDGRKLRTIEQYPATLLKLKSMLGSVEGVFNRTDIGMQGVVERIGSELKALESPLNDFVLAAYLDRSRNLTSGEAKLNQLSTLLTLSYIGILLSCVSLVLLLIRQIRAGRKLLIAKSGALEVAEHQSLALANSVAEHRLTEDALAREKELAMVTLGSIRDAVITTDTHGNITYLNPGAEKLTGYSAQSVIGAQVEKVLNLSPTCAVPTAVHPVRQCMNDGAIIYRNEDNELVNKDGKTRNVELTASPIRGNTGNLEGVVIAFRDVTRERKMTQVLSHQATHDSLTGLVNRREFERRLQLSIKDARRLHRRHVVLYLDLDQFKVVNDTCGHAGGDELLVRLTGLLQSNLRSDDTLARLGGDEFGVLLTGCSQDDGRFIAEKLRTTVDEFRFMWAKRTFRIGVSIGLVMVDESSGDSGQIMSAADIACYAAKDSGRNKIHQYQTADETYVKHHSQLEWVSKITQAMEEGRLRLFAQRIVSTDPTEQGADCYETLLRIRGANGETILPMAFLPAAERYNLMRNIDGWVVEHLFHLLQTTPHLREFHFTVNLSGQSLSDQRLLEWIDRQLDQSEIDPKRLTFEITETVAIANLQAALRFMRAVRMKGCTIALDDFGSGLSSFNYLKTLPVDIIKIDGGFIKDMLKDPVNVAVVESIVQVSRTLGLATVAEYVESEAVARKLTNVGVDYLQGFFVSVPQPIEDLVNPEETSTKIFARNAAISGAAERYESGVAAM